MTPQEDRPMDPLTELLAQAHHDIVVGPAYVHPTECACHDVALSIIAAIDPAKADAMRATLRELEHGPVVTIPKVDYDRLMEGWAANEARRIREEARP